jgi:hypothetical protein
MMKHLFLFLVLVGNLVNAQTINDAISKDIKSKTALNLSKIPVGSEKLYGFDSRADFDNCTLGNPIRMVTLTNENTLSEQDQWRVPVKLNGMNKTLFTVQKINGTYEIVDIGGRILSNELQEIENKGISVTYFLRLYSQKIDFVFDSASLNDLSQVTFLPLESAQLFLNARQKGTITTSLKLDEVLNLIK